MSKYTVEARGVVYFSFDNYEAENLDRAIEENIDLSLFDEFEIIDAYESDD